MLRDVLLAQIKADEGLSLSRYVDSLGYRSIGYGHLLSPGDAMYTRRVITLEEAQRLLEEDITTCIRACYILYDDFDSFPQKVQYVLANMAYNLGRIGLSRFVRMHAAITARNWQAAAEEMRDSTWYHQVGHRAERLAHEMETAGL